MSTEALAAATEQAAQPKVEQEQPKAQQRPLKVFKPASDLFETDEALWLTLDMPGVTKERTKITLENKRLSIEGEIDAERYHSLAPLYSEYGLGHYRRSFQLGQKIDPEGIEAQMEAGVLTLKLPKRPEVQPKRINVA